MEIRDKLSKLGRYELVELIYELRKSNIALEKRCEAAELRVAELERSGARVELEERIKSLERLISELQAHMDDVSGQKNPE